MALKKSWLNNSTFKILWVWSVVLLTLEISNVICRTSSALHIQPQRSLQQELSEFYNFNADFGSGQYNNPQVAGQNQNYHNVASDIDEKSEDLPLYKQSVPGLYGKGDLKEYSFVRTDPVRHGFSHHGRDGQKFLFQFQPDTYHLFRGVAHAIHHEDLN